MAGHDVRSKLNYPVEAVVLLLRSLLERAGQTAHGAAVLLVEWFGQVGDVQLVGSVGVHARLVVERVRQYRIILRVAVLARIGHHEDDQQQHQEVEDQEDQKDVLLDVQHQRGEGECCVQGGWQG